MPSLFSAISAGSRKRCLSAKSSRGRSMSLIYKVIFLVCSLSACRVSAESADWIIRAKHVITMDGQHRTIDNGALAIRGRRIIGIGTQKEINQRFQAGKILDRPDSIVAPGLIDTHTHAPMSLFRAIADDNRLQDWLTKVIFPAESKNVSPEFVRWGTRLACLETVLAGIATYTDTNYFEDVEAEAPKEAGTRGVWG